MTEMFCYQCEQAAKGVACTSMGVCGKDAQTAALQDLLMHAAQGISWYAHRAGQLGVRDRDINVFVIEALFTTVTNVNFDPQRIEGIIHRAGQMRDRVHLLYERACAKAGQKAEVMNCPADAKVPVDLAAMVAQGRQVGIDKRKSKLGDDVVGLQELLAYGLKGMAAYADHAQILGKEDPKVYAFIHEALDYLLNPAPEAGKLLEMCLKCGEVNIGVMGMLNAGHIEHYGKPTPTPVRVNPVKGKAIVVSGHDLLDLEELLKQTQGKGINVYTHSEMLPAHGYPKLKAYKHLVGNYGGAWQEQRKEFDEFPGAILMNTNCLQKPKDSYRGRIFTSGLVAWPGVRHISDRNFAPVIEAALKAPGFVEDGPQQNILVGFGHDAVLGVADKVIEAVKAGKIRRFFVIGGCDGAKPGRNYYTEFAEQLPQDCVILTLACGKYRFNKLSFGDIGGIPRLLDVGQCNDAYSAVQIALALASAFKCGLNDLPLSFILSWFEQKAVVILLSLLHLGIKNMRLGPSLPAFVTPAMLDVLVKNFNLQPIRTVQEDLAAALA